MSRIMPASLAVELLIQIHLHKKSLYVIGSDFRLNCKVFSKVLDAPCQALRQNFSSSLVESDRL
jgi:hypothetical protein